MLVQHNSQFHSGLSSTYTHLDLPTYIYVGNIAVGCHFSDVCSRRILLLQRLIAAWQLSCSQSLSRKLVLCFLGGAKRSRA